MRLKDDHPLRAATWIWPEGYMYLYNHFAHFRKDFELAKPPRKAPLFITADKAYKLYVNGVYVCRGPARGYQARWPFDEVDVAPQLRPGKNWIAIEAYTPGISTFQYLHQTKAGLLCAAVWNDFTLVSDLSWQMRRSPAHATRTARLSLQLDFQEHVDARLGSRAWITAAEPPTGWRAEQFPEGSQQMLAAPFGQGPWDTLEPRGIPLLREEVFAPAAVTSMGEGACGAGYETCENVSWQWVAEGRTVAQWKPASAVQSAHKDGALEIVVAPTGQGRFRAITVDIGRYIVGCDAVAVDGAAGGEILDFQHDQCLRKGYPEFIPPGRACLVALANRLRLAPGRTEHEFFHPLGFRHVTVIARDVVKPLVLRLRTRSVGYPFTMAGAFACSDDTLNRIHAISRHTQQLCALDAYVDTPWREQAQWWGDARVQAWNTFHLDGDARLLARGIRSIAGQRGPQNLTYGHAPTSSYGCLLPDFSLTWILTIWDYYWQTGDLRLFKEQWPRVKEVLAYFESKEARSHHGLLRHDRRFWLFGDWSTLYKGEVPTFLNLWYLLTLRHVVKLLELAGRKGDAAKTAAKADVTEKTILDKLYDADARLFRNGLDAVGQPTADAPSVHDQVMALMLGLAPDAHDTMMARRLVPYLKGEDIAGAALPSAFWATYVIEEAAKRGHGALAVAFIKRKWSPMLSTGTTWEGFDWKETDEGSACHAWTAHPSFHLVNILAGVTQTEPAWSSIRFAPVIAEGIDQAEATIPTPKGLVQARWWLEGQVLHAQLAIPEGMTADIALGDKSERIVGPASVRIHAAIAVVKGQS